MNAMLAYGRRAQFTSRFVILFFVAACASRTYAREDVGCVASDTAIARVDSNARVEDVRAGRTYSCVLHDGQPRIRVTLVADSAENVISRVELRREQDTLPFQVLDEGASESPRLGGKFFDGRDLDGDGYLDLMLLESWGATGNELFNVWRWNPARARFAFDSTLSAASSPRPIAGRPCVNTNLNGGQAGMIHTSSTLCYEGGRWVTIAYEDQQELKAGIFLRRTGERRGDTLAIIHVDTVRDTTNR